MKDTKFSQSELKINEGQYYLVRGFPDDGFEPTLVVDYYGNNKLYFRFLNGSIMEVDSVVEVKPLFEIINNVYFDIPNSEMSYAVYDRNAYFDQLGWYLIDSDGKKHYEDEKYLTVK